MTKSATKEIFQPAVDHIAGNPVIKDELAIFDRLDREADREFKGEIRKECRRTRNPAKRVVYRDAYGMFCREEEAVDEDEHEANRDLEHQYDDDGWSEEEDLFDSEQILKRGRSKIPWKSYPHAEWIKAVAPCRLR